MKTVMICGSRDATKAMIDIVQTMVTRIWWHRQKLIVGDAMGVDAEVVYWAENLGVDYECFTPHLYPRNDAEKFTSLLHEIKPYGFPLHVQYSYRDKYMVDLADEVICISRPEITKGTERVFEYAKFKRKPVTMRAELRVKE